MTLETFKEEGYKILDAYLNGDISIDDYDTRMKELSATWLTAIRIKRRVD